ncbi:hypothetical protein Pcinc_041536, partial [Petrolisthes cinctipes]
SFSRLASRRRTTSFLTWREKKRTNEGNTNKTKRVAQLFLACCVCVSERDNGGGASAAPSPLDCQHDTDTSPLFPGCCSLTLSSRSPTPPLTPPGTHISLAFPPLAGQQQHGPVSCQKSSFRGNG